MTRRDMSRLRIFSDRDLVPPGVDHVTMLCALWGPQPQLSSWPGHTDALVEHGLDLFEPSELADADLAVFPTDLKKTLARTGGPDRVRAFRAAARAAEKPVVYFFHSDRVEPLELTGSYVFRTSLNTRLRAPNEFALPGFHEDLLARWCNGRQVIRHKHGAPRVGFCGTIIRRRGLHGMMARSRRFAGEARQALDARRGRVVESDLYARARAIDALESQRDVEVDIVTREGTAAGAWDGDFDPDFWERVRREYVDNMLASDYALCVRGAGNWSYRLTEALSLGRIPVVISTDCVLPYDFMLNWRDYVVWIERGDISNIGERVAEFHERLTDAEFVELQRACRRLWTQYLSPLGFFQNFYRHFDRLAGS